MLHLSLSPCTGYLLQLTSSSRHWCLHIEQPQAQHPPTFTHYNESTSPPEVWDLLVSVASWYHHREAQNHSPEHSLSQFLAGGMIFQPLSRMLDPCQSSSNNWKLISFDTTWLHPKKEKNLLSLYLSLLPVLPRTYLDIYLVLQALPLSVCLFKIDVFPNCKSIWIKVSAKWLNVNAVQPCSTSVRKQVPLQGYCIGGLPIQISCKWMLFGRYPSPAYLPFVHFPSRSACWPLHGLAPSHEPTICPLTY